MHKYFLILLAAAMAFQTSIGPTYAEQSAPGCDGYTPEVNVQIKRSVPKFYDNFGTNEIARKTGIKVERDAAYTVPGVYYPVFRYDYNPKTKNINGAKGRKCTILTRLDMTVTVTQEIYVSSEFKPGSCYYEVIRSHEFHHAHLDGDALDAFVVYATKDLRAMFTDRNRYESRDQIKKLLRKRVKANIKRFNKERRKFHETIDRGGNHNFEFHVCDGRGEGKMRVGPSGGGMRLF